jgi:hypothetical protein
MNRILPSEDLLRAYRWLHVVRDASPEEVSTFPEIPQSVADVVRVKQDRLFASGTGDIIITLEPTERLTELVAALRAREFESKAWCEYWKIGLFRRQVNSRKRLFPWGFFHAGQSITRQGCNTVYLRRLDTNQAPIERFGLWMAFACIVGSIIVSLASIAAIIYFAVNSQWLPAIFFLLARREITEFLDSEAKRIGTLDKSESW